MSYPPGAPSAAALQSSRKEFLIFRRFGYLRNRMLLRLQQQIGRLEEDLYTMDLIASRESSSGLVLDNLEPGLDDHQRAKVFKDLHDKIS